jgi:hypothetical protein
MITKMTLHFTKLVLIRKNFKKLVILLLVLLNFLRKIFDFVKGHVHPISTKVPIPVASGNGVTTSEIDQLLADAENTILNQEIRIN